MTSLELRKKFLDFFKGKGHVIIPSSSLVPSDSSVLFTTAGMQQFKPYYLDEKSPYGENVVSVQKSFRTSDLDFIGDESHLSFFEMLGNFSFGEYFKEETIKYAHEFITKEMKLKIDYVSVFDPSIDFGQEAQAISADEESEKIWKSIDPSLKVVKAGKTDNFWGPTGDGGPCGPTTEIYIKNVEIWNLVFNEYYFPGTREELLSGSSRKLLEKLKILGVDTGMGLERLAMAVQKKNNIFETDLFVPIIQKIEELSSKKYEEGKKEFRIIADHIKAATFMLAEGLEPSNVERGYVLRRLIRRVIRYGKQLVINEIFTFKVADAVIDIYRDIYPELKEKKNFIEEQLIREEKKFTDTLGRGLKEFKKLSKKGISGKEAFDLYQTYGFPLEITVELAKEKEVTVDEKEFNEELAKHQELSRTATAGTFKSGLADHSEQVIKYHTAAHLMLAALGKVLGEHVSQKGSNITGERLRFDFSHPEKMTPEQIKQVEDIVNEKIREDLPVKMEEMSLEDAKKHGAMGVFESKYGEKVKVYSIGPSTSSGLAFSREICAGPHVEHTGVLGKFKIIKEESSSAGVRRIKAILE